MTTRYERLRFHVDLGPKSLFDRVRFKIQGRRTLRVHADHLRDRAAAREAPLEKLRDFDPAEWEMMTAEVRADKGTFVRTAWRREIDGRTWWVVIGYRDTIASAYPADTNARKLGADVVRGGDDYLFVATVNAELVAREQPKDDGDSMAT